MHDGETRGGRNKAVLFFSHLFSCLKLALQEDDASPFFLAPLLLSVFILYVSKNDGPALPRLCGFERLKMECRTTVRLGGWEGWVSQGGERGFLAQ